MEVILIPIIALMIPIVIVPTALAFRHARFLREVEHKERMRAMELGRLDAATTASMVAKTPAKTRFMKPPSRTCRIACGLNLIAAIMPQPPHCGKPQWQIA